ncbi:MAG TPA: polyprenyl synthetase family protein, partial [Bacteroidales bacterium]|nr:polyprenyl synthetase family protein [Bacteroidales bacterium]
MNNKQAEMLSLIDCQIIINRHINEIKLPELPLNLYEPIKYMLSLEAKRLRPSLVLMGCNVYSENTQPAIYPALAIEVFHNFTLIHDDIMDRSDLRRNHPTVHVKWNPSVAILSGDAMLIKAYELLSHPSIVNLHQILPVFNDTALRVCEGQQFDMDYESCAGITIDEYLQMVEYKTAVLVAAALKIGALTGGASDKDAELLYQFGRNLGIAFQLQDDLLDVFADSSVFGKVTGNDIVSNKKTILLIEALNSANRGMKAELLRWLGKTDFERNEKIRAVKEIYSSLHLEQLVNK